MKDRIEEKRKWRLKQARLPIKEKFRILHQLQLRAKMFKKWRQGFKNG